MFHYRFLYSLTVCHAGLTDQRPRATEPITRHTVLTAELIEPKY
jgi:hypothetical protein